MQLEKTQERQNRVRNSALPIFMLSLESVKVSTAQWVGQQGSESLDTVSNPNLYLFINLFKFIIAIFRNVFTAPV